MRFTRDKFKIRLLQVKKGEKHHIIVWYPNEDYDNPLLEAQEWLARNRDYYREHVDLYDCYTNGWAVVVDTGPVFNELGEVHP